MSIASPESRADLKEYIKTKLGAPVLQVNVSDEQMDVCLMNLVFINTQINTVITAPYIHGRDSTFYSQLRE